MTGLEGRRLESCPIGETPLPFSELQPGDYWQVVDRRKGEPLGRDDIKRWWPKSAHLVAGNLTGTVWGVIDPNGSYGMLSIHTVREHEDGTISVRPNDGSSNSIKITGRDDDGKAVEWHGYIEHGVWREV